MAISVTDSGSRITANAANVATQMGSGTTEAEAAGIGAMLTALSKRQDLMDQILKLANTTAVTPA